MWEVYYNSLSAKSLVLRMPVASLVPDITVSVSASSAFPLEGNQYALTCTVSGQESLTSSSVTFQWLRDSSTVQGPNTNNRLVFNPVDRFDNGTYTCRVTVSSSLLNNDIVEEGETTFSVSGMLLPIEMTVRFIDCPSMQFHSQEGQLV